MQELRNRKIFMQAVEKQVKILLKKKLDDEADHFTSAGVRIRHAVGKTGGKRDPDHPSN